MDNERYLNYLRKLQTELCILQAWIQKNKERVAIVLEGRDAAGKGGVIRALTERVNPRCFRVVALSKPTDDDKERPYFERYRPHLPRPGEVAIFDRSWYNRSGVEHVMNFDNLSQEALNQRRHDFFQECLEFERQLARDGVVLVKYWLEVSWAQQKKRIRARIQDPLRQWKLSPVDVKSLWFWNEYTEARDVTITACSETPWVCIDSNEKRRARLNCIAHFLTLFSYEYMDNVSQLLKELQPNQMPSLTEPPESAKQIECITADSFQSIESTETNAHVSKEARVLLLAAFDALLENDVNQATALIQKSIQSDRGPGIMESGFFESSELGPEEQAALKALREMYRKTYNPTDSYIISTPMGLLRQLEKMGLLTRSNAGSFGPTDKLTHLMSEQQDAVTKMFAEAQHLADLSKRSKLRKHLSTTQNQGVPPSMGWPLISGVHVAYKNGICGQGISIALLDTGICVEHPDFRDIVVHEIGKRNVPFTDDELASGTRAAGIIGSSKIGIAPRVRLIQVNLDGQFSEARAAIAKLLKDVIDTSERLIVYWPYKPSDSGEDLVNVLNELSDLNVLTVTAQTQETCNSPDAKLYNKYTLSVSAVGWKLEPVDNSSQTTTVVGYGLNVFSPTYPVGYSYAQGPIAAMAYACGIAALTWASSPNLSSRQLRVHLERHALRIKKKYKIGKLLRYIPVNLAETEQCAYEGIAQRLESVDDERRLQ